MFWAPRLPPWIALQLHGIAGKEIFLYHGMIYNLAILIIGPVLPPTQSGIPRNPASAIRHPPQICALSVYNQQQLKALHRQQQNL